MKISLKHLFSMLFIISNALLADQDMPAGKPSSISVTVKGPSNLLNLTTKNLVEKEILKFKDFELKKGKSKIFLSIVIDKYANADIYSLSFVAIESNHRCPSYEAAFGKPPDPLGPCNSDRSLLFHSSELSNSNDLDLTIKKIVKNLDDSVFNWDRKVYEYLKSPSGDDAQ